MSDFPQPLAVAQLARRQLAEIGLDITIKTIPVHIATAAYLDALAAPGAEWDIALVLHSPNMPDPHAFIDLLLDTQFIGGTNLARFESQRYDAAMRRASPSPGTRSLLAYADSTPDSGARGRAARRAQHAERVDARLEARRLHGAPAGARRDAVCLT